MPKPTRRYLIQQRQFERRQKIYESKYRGRFYKYLISVNKLIAKEIELNGFGVDVSRFIKYEDLERIYKNLYNEVTINEAEIQYTELEPQEQIKQKDLIDDLIGILAPESKPISLWKRLLNEFITVRIAGRITEVTDTTRRRISVLIEKGIEEGLGATQVAKSIREDQGYNRNRSLAIARTETITAANQGRYMAALSSPYVMSKKWLPKVDSRTRLSHADFIDRPWVEMEQLFYVANSDGILEPARYPCDVTLDASNTINCRCIVIFKVKEDSNGKPIRKTSI
jgi:hypothetical protein